MRAFLFLERIQPRIHRREGFFKSNAEVYKMMSKRFQFLAICIFIFLVVALSIFLLRGTGEPALAQTAGTQAQAAGEEPGSASDPVLTRASLEQRLEALTAGPQRDLEELQGRLARVEEGIRTVQDLLKASFPDLRGHRAEQAVNFLRGRGIIGGYPDGMFHPDEQVSRAALAVMLAKAKNLSPNPAAVWFKDVVPGHWAAGAIGAVKGAGYLHGYPDGRFRPDQGVTRAETAAILRSAFPVQAKAPAVKFRDLTGHWAAGDIELLAAAGILEGFADGTFRPDQAMSRADVAMALARILQQ